MQIISYTKNYQQGVLDLILNIQRNEFTIDITAEDQPDLQQIEKFYQRCHGNFWVALNDDEVIGTVALLDIGDKAMALRKMFVAAAYRGKQYSIAQSLLQVALNWAIELGMGDIFLGTTEQFLAAHRFYKKNNFKEITPEALPDSFPRMKVDSRFFQLSLVSDSSLT